MKNIISEEVLDDFDAIQVPKGNKRIRVSEKTWAKMVKGRVKGAKKAKKLVVGRLYTFQYKPKHFKTLPFYDKFPIILLIAKYPDGFLGLNLHYVSRVKRKILLRIFLQRFLKVKTPTNRTRLTGIEWNTVKNSIPEAGVMVKRYLGDHVQGVGVIEVPFFEWRTAILMPTQQFKGALATEIWDGRI